MLLAVMHGYLLRRTGSNLHVSKLCHNYCRQDHRVRLLSQEEEPAAFDFIPRFELYFSTASLFDNWCD